MERKIIFLDIDGTLTEPGSNVPPASAVKAVRQAQEKGHLVFLCSGRNYAMLSPLLSYGFDGVIASSGGYIICRGQVIYDCPMTEEQKENVLKVLKKNQVYSTIECLEGTYTDEAFKEFLKANGSQKGNSELLRWREQLEGSLNILPMTAYQGQPVYKVVIMCQSREQLQEPERVLGKEFVLSIQDADSFGIINGEVVNKKFDKGKGVERVCQSLGIGLEHTIGFGDSVNDIEMIQAVSVGVCMENGSESLKKIADRICPAVDKDGLYYGFEALGLL